MIPELRHEFNRAYTPAKYQRFLALLEERCGTDVKFRNSETPCFFRRDLLNEMVQAGKDLVYQLVGNTKYLEAARRKIPKAFLTPNEADHPLFFQADFGLVRDETGKHSPRLVEIQGFPSLYAYQPTLAEVYREAYQLDSALDHTLHSGAEELIRKAILGNHEPESVVLVEVDPAHQKTLADFLLTRERFGVRTVDIRKLQKRGSKLYDGDIPIKRIYNRAIADEIVRRNVEMNFAFSDDLDVEWAGHPNWFYLLSKFSLPYLRHATVPESYFLSDIDVLPADLDNYVLKPLYSFAGLGVKVGVSRDDVEAIPDGQKQHYLLQRRMRFEPVIETPFGMTQAEIRIMYVWIDSPVACNTIVRMGRGKMMGVDQNRDLEWVGASAGFYR